jgi:transcription initiation factor TFIIB
VNITDKSCPGCGAPISVYARWDEGRLICTKCGTIIYENLFDIGPEWRSFTEEDRQRRSRVGAPLTSRIHDKGLTSFVYARRNDPRQWKIVAIQARLRSQGQQKLIGLLQEANRVIAQLGLPPHVAETMARILRKLYAMGLIRKNNMNEYIAAAAIIASRIEQYPLSMRVVASKLKVSHQALWRAYSNIVTKLKVRTVNIPKPSMYVSRIVSKLNLNGEVESLAYRFTDLLVKTGIAQGKPPEALAAAAVYVASILLDNKRNQLTIAKAIEVTDATIRNRYRDIVDNFYIEVRL